jgi:C1A family cysteine protease
MQYGAVATAFTVYDDFFDFYNRAAAGEVYKQSPTAEVAGGHAVTVIGWSEAKQAWLVKNSWGLGGGDAGGRRQPAGADVS